MKTIILKDIENGDSYLAKLTNNSVELRLVTNDIAGAGTQAVFFRSTPWTLVKTDGFRVQIYNDVSGEIIERQLSRGPV